MASKKRTINSSYQSKKLKKDSFSSNESSDEEMVMDDVKIDFSAFEIVAEDSRGIQLLLRQLFLKNHVDLSVLTKYLGEQQLDVGSVIKESEIDKNNEDDDTVYGVIDVISLCPDENFKFIDQLIKMFLDLSKQHATQKTHSYINSMLNEPENRVGFLINERYLNMPPTISIPSFTKLNDEIKEQRKKDPRFCFTHYIMFSKLYKIPLNKNKKLSNNKDFEIVWCNAEDELFDKVADARFEYAVAGDCDSGLSGSWTVDDEDMLPFRRVLAFSAYKMDDIIQELSNFV